MKSIVIQNEQFQKLVSDYDTVLEENSYSLETRIGHVLVLKRIWVFMDTNGISDYSVSVGELYFQDYQNTHKNPGTCDVVKAIVKKFNVFFSEGFVPPSNKGVFYNTSLKFLMNNLEKELKEKSYPDAAIRFYRRLLRPVQHYMRKLGIDVYSPDVGSDYIDWYREHHNHVSKQVLRFISSCINRVNDICEGNGYIRLHTANPGIKPPDLFGEDVAGFLEYCRLSGNKSTTIRHKEIAVSQFLEACVNEGCVVVSDITPSIVIFACSQLGTKRYYYNVRCFLQYLVLSGKIENDLSTFVPDVRFDIKLPSTYTVDEISSAERKISRDDRRGKRDYAIFLLASRLGIRSGDILRMHKDSLDFNNGIISFTQHKTHKAVSHPMLSEIREALEDHLACSGYNPDGYVFYGTLAPYRLLSNTTIGNTITKYLKKASIDTTGKHHGPHSLRASMATSMVNDNVPYDVVRKTLGHSDPNAIKHYVKNDLENLRRCALDVPPASGRLLELLGEKKHYE